MFKMICPYKTGFVKRRLIADNGWTVNAIVEHLQTHGKHLPGIGALIDQEKAYDKVHPTYLRKVLEKFKIPAVLIMAYLISSLVHRYWSR